ncbi:RNA polymerase sigma factor [Xylanibacter muris]|uniref:Sigma-70 family RNA polymerase sigma factor n=1 Tax=Xylanibacter muris TaxID=2736290 RepID=A0ABX2AIC5_9BACT|nr:sigma-70 family RNA polymerase sigma factor [Xylanibacter muris]NPD90758.1 sigma-70 family RNA polymerase sigma factor [Xylanibacter muris]
MTEKEFEHIIHVLRPKVYSIGKAFFNDCDMADDVAQEVLMRLWGMRDRIDAGLGAEALAVRMAKNVCVSEWRRQNTRKTAAGYSGTYTAQQTTLEENDNRRILEQAIGRLTKTEQRLYRMRHEMSMDIAEISAVTGTSPRSISAMLSTARRKLLDMIRKQVEF